MLCLQQVWNNHMYETPVTCITYIVSVMCQVTVNVTGIPLYKCIISGDSFGLL